MKCKSCGIELIGGAEKDLCYDCKQKRIKTLQKVGIFSAIGLTVVGLLYGVSPIDFVPDTIPVVGWIDDLVMGLLSGTGTLGAVIFAIYNTVKESKIAEAKGEEAKRAFEEANARMMRETVDETVNKALNKEAAKKAEEPVKETVKEAVKEPVKEVVEDTVKETIEETSKEAIEETTKEVIEEAAKEAIEETVKEAIEEKAE